jgi:hypothetical protein
VPAFGRHFEIKDKKIGPRIADSVGINADPSQVTDGLGAVVKGLKKVESEAAAAQSVLEQEMIILVIINK